jgi:hypothetical protein
LVEVGTQIGSKQPAVLETLNFHDEIKHLNTVSRN